MRISHYQLRTLIESVIFEGFQSDQRYLAEKYPEHSQDIFSLQPEWTSWLMARFGDSPTQKEIHPFSDAILTVLNFSKKDAAIGEKWKTNEQFKNTINDHFPEGERAWRSPADATTMTVDQMELILGLAERKKQKIELKDDAASVESDRVGKAGPWNIWFPTTRENSCKIAGYDPLTMEPKTTWCTARTAGSNVFYNYIGRSGYEITLFYIIKDNPVGDEDWLSVGFINGKPELNGTLGGISVDRANKGLTSERLQSILGQHYNQIMNAMKLKNKSLGGKHPARQKIIDAAQSVEALNYLLKGLSKNEATDIKKIVSTDPNLQPDVIRILAEDPDRIIKSNISNKKNIPLDTLRKLAEDTDATIRINVASKQSVPQDVLIKFANDESDRVRRIVAYNENMPQEVLSKLANDESPSVREKVAYNENTPQEVLSKLANDESPSVREKVALNENTPQDALTKLANDKSVDVRKLVTKNINTLEAITKLAKDTDKYVRMGIAQNANTPPNIIRELAEDSNSDVRAGVARNKNTPIDIFHKLAEDTYTFVRSSVASNTSTPESILIKLAEDPYYGVRYSVADNKNAPQEAIRKLSQEAIRKHLKDNNIDVLIKAKDNPNMPTDLFDEVAKLFSINVNTLIANNRSTSPDVLIRLSADPEVAVRKAVAKNINTPKDVLIRLSEDPEIAVRMEVAKNINTPKDVLLRFSNDSSPHVVHNAREELKRRKKNNEN